MNPEESKRERAQRFISGSSRSRFGFGSRRSIQTRVPPISPKRSIPTEVLKFKPKIEGPAEVDSSDSDTTFGRLLLNFVQINNDLEAIAGVIEEDFKNTKEKNKEEVDEYRRRVVNRGKKITTKELKSDKKGIVETVKPFVSNFFSGAGGAVRSLALWKMLMGILNGDISAVVKGLFGIGLSFLPKIGMMIAGSIIKNLLASVAGNAIGSGISRGFGGGPKPRVGRATPAAGIGKWAQIASLGAGAVALGSAFAGSQSNESQNNLGYSQDSETQQRLEELTAQQKEERQIDAIPNEDLRKFQLLNLRFEKAIQFFIENYKKSSVSTEQRTTSSGGGGGGGGGTVPLGNMSLMTGDAPPEMKALMDTIASPESGGNYEAMYPSTTLPGATEMTISEVARRATGPVGKYQHKPQFLEERARAVGLDPTTAKFSPQNQDLITRGHITSVLGGDESKIVEQLKRDPESIKRRLEATTYTGLQKYGSDFNEIFRSRTKQYGGSSSTPSPVSPTSPRRSPDEISSNLRSSPSSEIAVNVIPVSSKKQTSSVANTGSELPYINPNYSGDRFSILTAGELNLIG